MFFIPNDTKDPEEGNNDKQKTKGRLDGRNLIDVGLCDVYRGTSLITVILQDYTFQKSF